MPNSNIELLRTFKEGKSLNANVEVRCLLCGKTWMMWQSHYYRGDTPCDCKHLKKKYPRLYSIYTNIKTRCYNEKSPNYKSYGERGIAMCDEWKEKFEPFMTWALKNGYSDDLTIERVDVNGNYEPSNCKWIPMKQQASNKQNTLKVGNVTLKSICKEHGLNYKLVHQYAKRHPEMTMEEVIKYYLMKLEGVE